MNISNRTVLLVEDDVLLMSMYKKKLENEGYKVLTAKDGQDGLNEVKGYCPDLVLTDLMMPRMNGVEMVKGIRADDKCSRVPVIVISNSSSEKDRKEMEKLKVRSYFVKADCTPADVVDGVKKLMN